MTIWMARHKLSISYKLYPLCSYFCFFALHFKCQCPILCSQKCCFLGLNIHRIIIDDCCAITGHIRVQITSKKLMSAKAQLQLFVPQIELLLWQCRRMLHRFTIELLFQHSISSILKNFFSSFSLLFLSIFISVLSSRERREGGKKRGGESLSFTVSSLTFSSEWEWISTVQLYLLNLSSECLIMSGKTGFCAPDGVHCEVCKSKREREWRGRQQAPLSSIDVFCGECPPHERKVHSLNSPSGPVILRVFNRVL